MIDLNLIQILIGEFYDKLDLIQEIVPRDARFPEAANKIKVAIGMRRAGKTYFVFQHIIKLLNEGIDKKRILYVNFEDDRLLPLNEQKLAKIVDDFYRLYPENYVNKCYLFFDEIQNVDGWPIVIRRMHDTKNAEIFLTGSSAKMLSKEISTTLRGRSLSVEIWPFSFNEFLQAKNISIDRSLFGKKTAHQLFQAFQMYMSEGGFPEIISYNPDDRQRTLQDYLDVVIFRDIIERQQIKNPSLIKYMILSMVHNAGKPFAINKFYHDCKSQGYQIGKDILYEYAVHIEDTYLAFFVPLFEKSIRKSSTNPKKLYAIDPGMVRALTLDYEKDLGRLFENIVYLDLRRLNCKINYFMTSEGYEIDFIAQTPRGHKKFFQVAWNADDQKTMEREKRALESGIKELSIEGEIITLESYLRHGIRL